MSKKTVEPIDPANLLDVPPQRNNGNRFVEPDLSQEETDALKVDDIIREMQGGGYMFTVRRKRTFEPDYAHVGKIISDDFDIEAIKHQYGGGRFRIAVTDSDGRFVRHFAFSIDESFQPRNTSSGNDNIELAKTVANLVKNKSSDSEVAMGMMERQNQQSKEFMMLMMQMQSESTKTMMGLMTAICQRPEPQHDNGSDFSTAITPILVKMIEQSNAKSTGNGLDIKGLIELREFLTPEREERGIGGGIMDALVAAAPSILPIFMGGAMKQPQPIPSGFQQLPSGDVLAPIPPAHNEAVTPSPLPPDGSPPQKSDEIALIPLLKLGAKNDSDAESYAFVVLDLIGSDSEEQLLKVLQAEGWEKGFAMFSAAEMVWLAGWRDAVIDILTDADEDDEVKTEPKIEPKITFIK